MIKVRTEIFDTYFSAMTDVEVDEILYQKVMQPLDVPSPNADATERMLCTDSATIRFVITKREVLAKKISEAITYQLLDYMSRQDTVMGYKVIKEEK